MKKELKKLTQKMQLRTFSMLVRLKITRRVNINPKVQAEVLKLNRNHKIS